MKNPADNTKLIPTCSHWGDYLVETDGNAITAIHPVVGDPAPS